MIEEARGVGELTVVESLPEAIVAAFGVLTHLGSPFLLLVGVTVLYVAADRLALDRRAVGFVLAVAVGGAALTLALKTAFVLPRPPGAAETGYGFPSGHAIGATVVWGALARVTPVGTAGRRAGIAALIVAVVAASRVVIGVHYLVDVVAGVVVGAAFLLVAFELGPGIRRGTPTEADVRRAFLLAVGIGLVGLTATVTPRVSLVLGTAIGGAIGWRYAAAARTSLAPRGTAAAAAGLAPLVAGIGAVDELGVGGARAVAVGAALTAGLVVLPRVVGRLSGGAGATASAGADVGADADAEGRPGTRAAGRRNG